MTPLKVSPHTPIRGCNHRTTASNSYNLHVKLPWYTRIHYHETTDDTISRLETNIELHELVHNLCFEPGNVPNYHHKTTVVSTWSLLFSEMNVSCVDQYNILCIDLILHIKFSNLLTNRQVQRYGYI